MINPGNFSTIKKIFVAVKIILYAYKLDKQIPSGK